MTTVNFIIKFSSGKDLICRKLDENAVIMLKDNCPNGEILCLESLSKDRHQYHYKPSARAGWFSSRPHPFVDDKNKPPEPGRYQLILASNKEELFEYGLSGSTLEILKSAKTLNSVFGTEAHPQQILLTDPSSQIKYRVDVVFSYLIISLDFSNFYKDRLLSAQPPIDVNHGGKSFGAISGQISNLSGALPYESWAKIISLLHPGSVLVTGSGWSGSIAHSAAIMLREFLQQCNMDLPVKAVSFDGPLCGSGLLLSNIEKSNHMSDHITICNNEDIMNRLLFDFQKLSPLMKDGNIADQKRFMFEFFNSSIKQYQSWKDTIIDLNHLEQAERNLSSSIGITPDNELYPVGRFLFRQEDGEFTDDFDYRRVTSRLQQFQNRLNKSAYYTYHHVGQYKPTSDRPRIPIPPEINPVRPKLTKFNMIQTKHRVTMNFEGEYLDTLKCRLTDRELEIRSSQLDNLPFNFRSAGTFEPKEHAKIVSLAPSWGKVVIEVIGCSFGREGEISLYTDLGETNAVRFNTTNIVDGQESAPSKSIHPTMNAEFLSAAALRIALYCRSKKDAVLESLESNPRLSLLWELLLSLEKKLCSEKDRALEKNLNQFLRGDTDIATMRNMCIGIFADISRKTVQDFVPKENILLRGVRKIFGILGIAGSGALLTATFFLLLPPALLFLPLASFHANAIEGNYGSLSRIGLGIHFTFSGVLALPSAIIGSIGYFLYGAAQFAMRDPESLMYKRILRELLQSLGGSHLEVVDELCPLEDRVIELFMQRFPSSKELYTCKAEDIKALINNDLRTKMTIDGETSEAAKMSRQLKQIFDNLPILIDKLILVGHISAIRMILEYNILIGFAGVHNAGKSTTVNKLFGFDTNASLLVRTEEPMLYQMGNWIESQARHSDSRFREWLAGDKKDRLQISAVDFPGTDDERLGVALITRYTAEVASMFIVILKAGHVAGPEKEVVKVAIDNHKPFLVVINYCDTIKQELNTPARFERIKETYAKVLGIPESMLCFMSALSPRDVDNLRCMIYSMVQNILGDSSVSRSLALHFITDQTMERLLSKNKDSSLLDNPDGLCEAASSLLLNATPISEEQLIQRILQLNEYVKQETEKKFDHTMAKTPGIMDDLVQLACRLDIDDDVFEIVTDTFLYHYKRREALMGVYASPQSSTSVISNYLTAEALSDLNQKIQGYFTGRYHSVFNTEGGLDMYTQRKICTDVLLGFHSLFNIWKERGNEACVVKTALKSLLYSESLFNDNNMLQCIFEAKSMHQLELQQKNDQIQESPLPGKGPMLLSTPTTKKSSSKRFLDSNDIELSGLDSSVDVEYNRYNESKRRMDTVKQWVFTTSTAMKHNNQGRGTIEEFQSQLKDISSRFNSILMIPVSKDNLLDCVIEGLLSLTEAQLETADIRFNLIDDPSIDAHGVTRSVLTKVAEYINANPSEVMLRKDSDSGLLYFDPQYCYAGDKKVAQRRYLGLGRIIGLCLRKSINEVTFPINFPVTIYKWLLGYSIGLTDLSLISPQVSSTIYMICRMEEDELNKSQLFFSANLDLKGEIEYNLCPSGDRRQVTKDNRMDFLRAQMQLHLCCFRTLSNSVKENPVVQQLALGVQHLCARDGWNRLSPVSLQLIIEGVHDINVEEWRAFTDVKNGGYQNDITIDLFWKVVGGMSVDEKQRLLCFSTGTSSLPSNGFEVLKPRFTLVVGTVSPDALPEAHTCFNMLLLPRYTSEETMRSKLLMATSETDTIHMGML